MKGPASLVLSMNAGFPNKSITSQQTGCNIINPLTKLPQLKNVPNNPGKRLGLSNVNDFNDGTATLVVSWELRIQDTLYVASKIKNGIEPDR